MEQLFFAGKAYLKINSPVKTPLQELMAVERSGLWAPAEVRFEFLFILIGLQINNGFFIGQSGRVLKFWYTGGGPEQRFWRLFADIYRSYVLHIRLRSFAVLYG